MKINDYIFDIINNIISYDIAFKLFKALDYIGGVKVSVFIISIVCLYLYFINEKMKAKFILLLITIHTAIIYIVKVIVHKPRPESMIILEKGGALPSGHVAMATLILLIVWYFRREIRNIIVRNILVALSVLWVLIMIVDRLYLYVHDIYDVSASLIITFAVYLLYIKYQKIYIK